MGAAAGAVPVSGVERVTLGYKSLWVLLIEGFVPAGKVFFTHLIPLFLLPLRHGCSVAEVALLGLPLEGGSTMFWWGSDPG